MLSFLQRLQRLSTVMHYAISYQTSYFTYLWANVVEGVITGGTSAGQEILITGAREAVEWTGAI